ncbi:hypothetical protein ACG7TL_002066 [Trametes sanguinea]
MCIRHPTSMAWLRTMDGAVSDTVRVDIHVDLDAVPSISPMTDKVDPGALVSQAVPVDAAKTKESPTPQPNSQPLTFIVNLPIQTPDQADGQKHDGLKSGLQFDSSSEPCKASQQDGPEPMSISPPSLSLDTQGASSSSPSAPSDQAESESVSTPVDVLCPPGLQQERQPEPASSPVALAQTLELPVGAHDTRSIHNSVPDDVAVVVQGQAEAASSDVLAQTAEGPHAENDPRLLTHPACDGPAVLQVPEAEPYKPDDLFKIDLGVFHGPDAGPYIPDDIFKIDLKLFEVHNPALYSIANVEPLDSFIPPSIFPDKLLVHDPTHLTQARTETSLRRDTPITYVRVVPKSTDSDKPSDVAKNGGRVAHLYLSSRNVLGSGNHSFVYRAPLEVRLDPSSPARSRVRVAVKTADPVCGAHGMLWQEARMYNTFPKGFMEDTVRTVDVTRDSGSTEDGEDVQIRETPTSQSAQASPAAESSQAGEASQKADAPEQADASKPQTAKVVGDADAVDEGTHAPEPLQGSELDDAAPCDAAQVQAAAPEASKADGGCTSAGQDEAAAPPVSATKPAPASSTTVQRTEVMPAVVPKFFGFYVPVLPNGEVFRESHERSCGRYNDATCSVDWPTPILLVEECGTPIDPWYMEREQREEIRDLWGRLHNLGFFHGSPYPRNMLVQPGPLSAPREQRSMDSPSFRIIDFGRGDTVLLGCRKHWIDDWIKEEKSRVKRELRL